MCKRICEGVLCMTYKVLSWVVFRDTPKFGRENIHIHTSLYTWCVHTRRVLWRRKSTWSCTNTIPCATSPGKSWRPGPSTWGIRTAEHARQKNRGSQSCVVNTKLRNSPSIRALSTSQDTTDVLEGLIRTRTRTCTRTHLYFNTSVLTWE